MTWAAGHSWHERQIAAALQSHWSTGAIFSHLWSVVEKLWNSPQGKSEQLCAAVHFLNSQEMSPVF